MKMRLLYLAILALLLVACGGGGSSGLPPVRPTSTVSGNAAAAEIQNGQVAVYALDSNGKGALLGSTVTDAQGFYSLNLQIPSQPVLIEVTGGHYKEESSGVDVTIAGGQVLRAVARYQTGQPLSLMVTPLTQLAAGLAQYRIAKGTDPATAVDSALSDVSQLFGVSIANVQPYNITNPNGATSQLTAPYTYGFLLAALSSFTEQVSQQNNVSVHTAYTSLSLAQVMYNDIVSDGVLNGRGLNKTGNTMMDLAMGTVALNQDVYRLAIAQHLLAVSDSPQNKTGLGHSALLNLAQTLSNNTNALFGSQPLGDTTAFAPVIVPVLAEGSAFNGVYNFAINITSVPGIASVSFTVDGTPIGNAIDPANPAILIDTQNYTTGTHTIGVTATDYLGLSSHQDLTYNFGDVFVNVTSASATNQTPFTLTGNYDDQGLGFQSLTVQGNAVTPNADKTWSAPVDLALGRNHIPIVLQTVSGVSAQIDTIVDYDVGPPTIDTSAGHGNACFSNGDGTCTVQALADSNLVVPIDIETDHTELAGVAETRTALDANNIPYFAFTVSDPASNGVNTAVNNLKVQFQYEKNSNVIIPWTLMTPVNGEFLLPLATEVLSSAWLNSAPSDIQTLRVEVEDQAGNITNGQFTFKVEFVVAAFTMGNVADVGDTAISSVSFDQRSSLYNTTITVEEYPFTNTTGKAFYISPSDSSTHNVDDLIDQLVRENQVRLETSTEWQAGFVENLLDGTVCPSMPKDSNNNDKWTPITQLLNNVGHNTWSIVTVPDPTFGAVQSVSTDTPTAPDPTAWTLLPDFDSTYNSVTYKLQNKATLSLNDDYIMSTATQNQPAAVRNWQVVNSDSTTVTCPDVYFLQQRLAYSYQSEPGYPKNTASTLHAGATFPTSGFTVFDVTANAEVTAVNGWYLIPASHDVIVRKQVTLPALTVYNDIDVADPLTFTSYTPHLYDRTLTWSINRSMTMSVAHDGGIDNLLSMSSRDVLTGTGAASYLLSR